MPALALVAIVIVLMSFEFRLGNHFDSPAAILKISGLLKLTNLTVAYVLRKSGIKSRPRQSEASNGATATYLQWS